MILKGLGPDEPYWRGLSDGVLTLPQCHECSTWHWPAVSRCGICGCWVQDWHEVTLEGVLFTWTRTWHSFLGAEGLKTPFICVVVELPQAGGRRVLGLLDDSDGDPVIGTRVVGVVRPTQVAEGEIPALHWRVAA